MRLSAHKDLFLVITILLLLATPACSIGDNLLSNEPGGPDVAISSPTGRRALELGREIQVESVSIDSQGVARVELILNGQVIWADANAKPEPETPFIVAQPWTPETQGRHVIQVRAYNLANVAGESAPLTVEVVLPAAQAGPATATPEQSQITILAATPTATLSSGILVTPSPTATTSPTLATPLPTATTTNTPTATPRPRVFSPTGLEAEGRFREIWLELGSGESRLGYPTTPEVADRNYAKQFFERGLMIWWDDPDDTGVIWVLDSPAVDFGSGDTSNQYEDTWTGGDEISCVEAGSGGPVRGFGKLWCDHPELQTRLGFPSEPESGSGGRPPYARVQLFQGGTMIHNPINSQVYVLFAQGDWLAFDD